MIPPSLSAPFPFLWQALEEELKKRKAAAAAAAAARPAGVSTAEAKRQLAEMRSKALVEQRTKLEAAKRKLEEQQAEAEAEAAGAQEAAGGRGGRGARRRWVRR